MVYSDFVHPSPSASDYIYLLLKFFIVMASMLSLALTLEYALSILHSLSIINFVSISALFTLMLMILLCVSQRHFNRRPTQLALNKLFSPRFIQCTFLRKVSAHTTLLNTLEDKTFLLINCLSLTDCLQSLTFR